MPRKSELIGGGNQHARFIETAKALECDEDEARFREKLGKIAKVKPTQEKSPKVG